MHHLFLRALVVLCLLVLWPNFHPCFAQNKLNVDALMESPEEVYQALQALLQMEEEFDPESRELIQLAKDKLYISPQEAALALTEFIRINDHQLRNDEHLLFDGIDPEILVEYAVENNPEMVKQLNLNLLDSIINAFTTVSSHVKNATLSTQDSFVRWYHSGDYAKMEEKTLFSLRLLRSYMENTSIQNHKIFWKRRNQLLQLNSLLLESMVNLWSTSGLWALEMEWAVQRFISPVRGQERQFNREDSREHLRVYNHILNQEKDIGVFRAWVNGENMTVAALSALLVAEGVCTLASGGLCAGTIPATAGMMARIGQAAATGARVVVATQAAVGLVDRYRFEGANGLLNIQSLVDAMLLVSLIPAPSLKLLNGTSSVRVLGYDFSLRFLKGLSASAAHYQQMTAKIFVGLSGGYGIYQILNAQRLSEELKAQGEYVSANSIRAQGGVNLALGILGGLSVYRYNRDVLKQSTGYQDYLRRTSPRRGIRGALGRLSPTRSVGNILLGLGRGVHGVLGNGRSVWQNIKFAGRPLLTGTALSAYQFAAYGTYSLMTVTYSDYSFRKNSKELPELKEGEIALTLNGFSENDLLYHAFASPYANQHEIEKFGHTGRNYYGFFKSPSELFQQIKYFSEHYGRIRYLKILSHGIPGHLVPDANNITGEGESLLNADFLQAHSEDISQIGLESMSEDAQVVIVSCLVGGNLEEDLSYKGIPLAQYSGDEFLESFGRRMLPYGGTIDSSRRIILAIEGTMGPLLKSMAMNGMAIKEHSPIIHRIDDIKTTHLGPVLSTRTAPSSDNNRTPSTLAAPNARSGMIFSEQKAEPDMQALMESTTTRFLKMMRSIWQVVHTFGLKLEGNLLADKHHRVEIPARVSFPR